MKITVKLHAVLKKHLAAETQGVTTVEIREGATVRELIERLGIPLDHAGMKVSGSEQLELTSVLHEGQEVSLFPPLAGGIDPPAAMRRG